MKDMDKLEELTEIFKAFSDLTRLKLIKLLSESRNPLCVNALSKKLSVTQSAVSQHLRILKQAGIVTGSRRGYHVHYEIDTKKLEQFEKLFKKTFGRKPGKSA
jgi:ArsR family transcriptional regulator